MSKIATRSSGRVARERMRIPLRSALFGAMLAAAALVPLFGDPRATPVTHPIWGRMLLRALDVPEALHAFGQASQVFATLSWRDSLAYAADRFSRSDGVDIREDAGRRQVVAGEGVGQVVYPLAVVQTGDYRFRLRLASGSGRAATAEIVRLGGGAVKTFTFATSSVEEWVPGGEAHLDPGRYEATVLLPPGASLAFVEVAPPCLAAIEPPGGWHPTAVTTVEDVAVTGIRALDLESELPPADLPLELPISDFEIDTNTEPVDGGKIEPRALRGGPNGLRALVSVIVPEPGLYTVWAFGVAGGGQRWTADGCRKAIACPSSSSGWRAVMSQAFSSGRHTLAVALADGAVVERVRIERKKDAPLDYLAALRRLGFDPGAGGAVSRERAEAAMDFVRERHRSMARRVCGDVVVPERIPLVALASSGATTSGVPAAPVPTAPLPPQGLDVAILPPQDPASPISPATAEAPR